MNAVLRSIPQAFPARVLQRPRYDNTYLRNFRRWYVDNEPRISQWYADLSQWGDTEAADYFEFAAVQHDIELARVTGDGS